MVSNHELAVLRRNKKIMNSWLSSLKTTVPIFDYSSVPLKKSLSMCRIHTDIRFFLKESKENKLLWSIKPNRRCIFSTRLYYYINKIK